MNKDIDIINEHQYTTATSEELFSEDNNQMSSLHNVLLRASIIFGLVAAVVTIVYFTPMPEQKFKSCDRPCHALDWPMICRIKLNLEIYRTMSGVCEDCPRNISHCTNEYCTSANGAPRLIITANRRLPGPPIHVCHQDVLVVDVINKIPGHSVTVHWRGQPNNEAPYMDGVPQVTQCPIQGYTTFQYKFRASAAGTHLYHAYADSDRADGFFGALIVRQPDTLEPHKKLYDYDLKEHVILISEWSSDMTSLDDNKVTTLLINGKAPLELADSLSVFQVEKGKRYRFRVAYTGGNFGCPTTLSIDGHRIKVIALDGNPVQPYEVHSINLGKGERVDFVLKANQQVGDYYMKVNSNCNNNNLDGLAKLSYVGSINLALQKPLTETNARNFSTSFCTSKLGKICLKDIGALKKIPDNLKDEQADRTIFLTLDSKQIARSNNLQTKIYRINNLTFTYPSSPLLTQLNDINMEDICDEFNFPSRCKNKEICECVHVEYIPLGALTEIFLINQDEDDEEHIFHFHGNKFFIIGSRTFDERPNVELIKELAIKNQLISKNLNNPIMKDTIRVSKYSVVVLRFSATNPGFWILRDENSKGWTRGMDIVFQVGVVDDMASTPSNFPTCGSFVGPDFFLM